MRSKLQVCKLRDISKVPFRFFFFFFLFIAHYCDLSFIKINSYHCIINKLKQIERALITFYLFNN